MEMIHGDFKIGEVCPRPGTYTCINCRRAGRRSVVTVELNGVFPFCPICKERGAEEMDIVWKLA